MIWCAHWSWSVIDSRLSQHIKLEMCLCVSISISVCVYKAMSSS